MVVRQYHAHVARDVCVQIKEVWMSLEAMLKLTAALCHFGLWIPPVQEDKNRTGASLLSGSG
jgi:hypothetical protein